MAHRENAWHLVDSLVEATTVVEPLARKLSVQAFRQAGRVKGEALVALTEPTAVLVRRDGAPFAFPHDAANAPKAADDRQLLLATQVVADVVKADDALLGSGWVLHEKGKCDRRATALAEDLAAFTPRLLSG